MTQVFGFSMESVFLQDLETIENRCQKGARRCWGRPRSTYSKFLTILGNSAKSLFVDLALKVNKINQEGSKAFPGTAGVVLTRVSGSPGVPSGGARGGKPPRIIDQIIDQKRWPGEFYV